MPEPVTFAQMPEEFRRLVEWLMHAHNPEQDDLPNRLASHVAAMVEAAYRDGHHDGSPDIGAGDWVNTDWRHNATRAALFPTPPGGDVTAIGWTPSEAVDRAMARLAKATDFPITSTVDGRACVPVVRVRAEDVVLLQEEIFRLRALVPPTGEGVAK